MRVDASELKKPLEVGLERDSKKKRTIRTPDIPIIQLMGVTCIFSRYDFRLANISLIKMVDYYLIIIS